MLNFFYKTWPYFFLNTCLYNYIKIFENIYILNEYQTHFNPLQNLTVIEYYRVTQPQSRGNMIRVIEVKLKPLPNDHFSITKLTKFDEFLHNKTNNNCIAYRSNKGDYNIDIGVWRKWTTKASDGS